jgi:D-glycero-D-manno-heptose 1,7-bisphosphate phosphatase
VILDRDGTLNKRVRDGYVLRLDEMIPAPDILSLQNIKYLPIVVATNQACINKGLISENQVIAITKGFIQSNANINIKRVYVCPHLEIERCFCRKPQNLLLLRALLEFNLDPEDAVFVGDSNVDRDASMSLGIRFIPVCWDNTCNLPNCKHSLNDAIASI